MSLTIVGIDLAKQTFQIHGSDKHGKVLFKQRMGRNKLMALLPQLPPTVVAMEACSTAHYWGRYCQAHGHEVRLVPTQYARTYVKTNKNDAADAQAIAEAASRSHIRFVPVKSEEQQSVQALHRVRDRLKRDRTALANEIRGLLSEYGILFSRQLHNLRRGLDNLQASSGDGLPPLIQGLLQELREDLAYLDQRIARMESQIKELNRQSELCRRLLTIPGIGDLNASAFVAAIGSAGQFRTGRDLAAWLGLAPRQHSSGARERLLGISKRGNSYLRRILIHGARAYTSRVARRRDCPRNQLEKWIVARLDESHINKVSVAVANKLARIIWAVLRKNNDFYSPPCRNA